MLKSFLMSILGLMSAIVLYAIKLDWTNFNIVSRPAKTVRTGVCRVMSFWTRLMARCREPVPRPI